MAGHARVFLLLLWATSPFRTNNKTKREEGGGRKKRTEPFVMRGTFEVKDGGRRRRRKTPKN
jgi:hypothetical protein